MTTRDITVALQRAQAVFERRPDKGLHDDSPAVASWQGGARVVTSHANGTQFSSDMPVEFGGGGGDVTPGWLFRAGLAACANTTIVLTAAAQGIELTALEVVATSRSDSRGVLGMPDDSGAAVDPSPQDMQLHVRIAARGVSPQRLHALVEEGCRRSPVPCATQGMVPIALRIDAIDA
jgi:uncharacterized OsmC-like protein